MNFLVCRKREGCPRWPRFRYRGFSNYLWWLSEGGTARMCYLWRLIQSFCAPASCAFEWGLVFLVFVLLEVWGGLYWFISVDIYWVARVCVFVKLHITKQLDSDVLSFLFHTYEYSQWRLPFQKYSQETRQIIGKDKGGHTLSTLSLPTLLQSPVQSSTSLLTLVGGFSRITHSPLLLISSRSTLPAWGVVYMS